ncbi:hypothetical protein [Halorarius litoreus]|uniref:hypothetical protein n=1 Tax=Halorarius litoreus TaxID=2962676 RepID=UPI0020CF5D7C|nr:hypothetical protein [Halorarius litoreus]
MTTNTNLGVVLELLRADPELQSSDGLLVRGETSVTAAQREAVVDHVRTDTDAQLTLFLLATEMKADATASESAFRDELQEFAEAVHERFGVNLLRTAAAHPERLPARVPDDLLTDEAIAALDA